MSDERQMLLQQWLTLVLGEGIGPLAPASADASFRRYWRFYDQGRSLIAVDAPPEHEDSARFTRLARAFRNAGLNAPEVLAEDHTRGFLVVSDLGSRTYLDVLTAVQAPTRDSEKRSAQASALTASQDDRLYGDAITALIKLQRGLSTDGLPVYDAAFLRRELDLFRQWLLAELLRLDLSESESEDLERLFALLIDNALEQPVVAVHRDFHSRNLMLTDADNPGILDLQDAVAGPLSYDLASMLKDCYIAWPRERVLAWVEVYAEQAQAAGLLSAADRPQLVRWFDLMGAQRHLKAAGIFARLAVRDGKPGYLADLPRTLDYLQELGPLYPALQPLATLIRQRVVPCLSAR
ncbi:phosphotransferase [Lamprobacter modestohalophilus]|uniref:aminoglycoside phosphotransferase family protein n=1 Tax=Lamprobacter modestohalophilus TaxID=1064514 RepID=UPI002ADEBFE2|nr:phosphotransferase [Lamprobacter modestohalophilus]MEA1051645.1 phosphotransferase [Lamprobacter modestohalophilus]